MTRAEKLRLAENIEANAHRLLDDAAALRAELSGGSDSSNFHVLPLSHRNAIIAKRRKHQFK